MRIVGGGRRGDGEGELGGVNGTKARSTRKLVEEHWMDGIVLKERRERGRKEPSFAGLTREREKGNGSGKFGGWR